MTTRIGSYGSSQQYLQQILNLQDRINQEQTQVSTGHIAQNYSGISQAADSVLNYQVSDTITKQYQTDNDVTTTKLQAASSAVTGIQTTVNNFEQELQTFQQNGATDQQSISQIQTFAFQALQDMQAYLGSNINGDYLFSGGKSNTVPMQLAASTLSGFQSIYNGSTVSYPTTGAGDLLNANITSKEAGSMSFVPSTGVIVAAQSSALSAVQAGSNITISGTTSNNGTYTVKSQAATNASGAALGETTSTTVGAGAGTTIEYGSTPTVIAPATTGALNFAFAPNGQMTMTPTTANTLAALTTGTNFTISNSDNAAWDGSFQVVSNVGGVVTLQNNETPADAEQVSSSSVSLSDSTSAPGVKLPLTAGTMTFASSTNATTGLTSVTVTSPGSNDFSNIAVGDYVSFGGTADHNGAYKVTSVSGNTLTYSLNPDAIRVSQLLPQTGRTDVTLTGNDSQGNASSFTATNYGSLSFSPTGNGGETITAANTGAFVNSSGSIVPESGTLIKLASGTGVNDGTYTVVSNDGTNIVVQSNLLSSESNSTTAAISSTSYYQGDSLQQQQIIDEGRTIDVGTNAADPAFEKAIRAMSIIAQGAFGTAGGLDQNMGRVSNALYLLKDAIQSPAAGTPPYGPESSSDLTTVSQNIGYTQQIISQRTTTQTQVSGYLQTQISNQINSDPTTTVTELLNDSNTLQAAYEALSKIQGLSLINYLK